jgi:hypothetical protein
MMVEQKTSKEIAEQYSHYGVDGKFSDVVWLKKEETNKEFEILRKNIMWWLQRFIKDEYTIFQVKRHINKEFFKVSCGVCRRSEEKEKVKK